jgi:RNA polymerase sigma-70 factor (ECF subfamily)
MHERFGETTRIGELLDQIRAGDDAARDELLGLAGERFRRLAHKMLHDFPRVARWEGTDDVLQNAILRLCRALRSATPESARSLFNLAALQIRRELIDLARHYQGPHGMGAHHESVAPAHERQGPRIDGPGPDTNEPGQLAGWTEFHERIEALPDEEREVFNLVWYQGLTQAEAAALIGVSERVVKWRWRAARLALHRALKGESPE